MVSGRYRLRHKPRGRRHGDESGGEDRSTFGSLAWAAVIAAVGALATATVVAMLHFGGSALHALFDNEESIDPPFHAQVVSPIGVLTCTKWILADRPPDEVPPTKQWPEDVSNADFYTSDALWTGIFLTITGTSDQAVVLNSLKVDATPISSPLPGAIYAQNGEPCGGFVPPRRFDVVLDRHPPTVKAVPGERPSGKAVPAIDFPYKVSASEPEVLIIDAFAARCDCEWVLKLEWVSGDKSGVMIIDNHGEPFRTVSAGTRDFYYNHPWKPKSGWIRSNPPSIHELLHPHL
jgi:hypothetical protein